MNSARKQITVDLPPGLYESLLAQAEIENRSPGDVFSSAVMAYLSKKGAESGSATDSSNH